jgi:3-oxoacyl-[acyl-carrier-protein] synthase III
VTLVGLAGIVGSRVFDLDELAARFDLAPERIVQNTGVTRLRQLGPGESLVRMARDAARAVLDRSGVPASGVRAIFGSSNPTADDLVPTFTAACAHAIGLSQVIVDHVGTGCCGGLQALRNAYNQLFVDGLEGRIGHALVVAGDQTSRILDAGLARTGAFFGEGVSVALLSNDPAASTGYVVERVSTCSLLGESLYALRLRNPYAAAAGAELPRLEIEGGQIFELGTAAIDRFLSLLDLDAVPPDCFVVPHQPNLRLLEALIARAGLDADGVYVDGIRTIGNTTAPAAFLGLEDALRRGKAKPGDAVVLGAFGAELQVGAALLTPINPRALVAAPSLTPAVAPLPAQEATP